MTEKQIIRKCKKCGAEFAQIVKHDYKQGCHFTYCQKCRKPKQGERKAVKNCLYCNRELRKNQDVFCCEMCKLQWEIMYRRLINLQIPDDKKTEIVNLWRKGQIKPIIERLDCKDWCDQYG